ncbi:MAG: polymer-forming cytoskeletal protein [Spirochaetota bacterium]|nr:polymer-forming cytoskeletal protein [Spirochaetota bacterium]
MAGKNDSVNSAIGEGSTFEGKFYISGSLRIDGKFEGEIKTDEELVVGETGKVKTNIDARYVIIAGTVIGNINATEEVRLIGSSKVSGDIVTPILTIEKGVIADGRITVTGGENKNIKKLVDECYTGDKVKEKENSKEVK